jgi:hypothetical protein
MELRTRPGDRNVDRRQAFAMIVDMRFLFLSTLCVAACGGASDDRDAGRLRIDSGTDAGLDAGMDAGIDCSTVGCGAPALCHQGCLEPCGCCTCEEGAEMTSVGGVDYMCVGGCWEERGNRREGDLCEAHVECALGFSCCYPCGIPDCENQCMPTCEDGDPGCEVGCEMRI